MKILIITDADKPQVNGVVKTLYKVKEVVENIGHEVILLSHNSFRTFPCPTYPEIKLVKNPWRVGSKIKNIKPDAIHIATEGPLGLFSKLWCDRNNIPYSTSYHTMFPEYLHSGLKVPLFITYSYFRWFHSKSKGVLVPTYSVKKLLDSRLFKNVKVWTRGVNHKLFNTKNRKSVFEGLERPIYINVGRVSQEKGLEDFLSVKLKTGTKVLVGDGPMLDTYKRKYTDVVYTGYKHGQELADHFKDADVFVFPSKTDTFGLVNVEALACGLPVLAYDIQGPKDIITYGKDGILVDDKDEMMFAMQDGVMRRFGVKDVTQKAKSYTWEECAKIFLDNLKIKKDLR